MVITKSKKIFIIYSLLSLICILYILTQANKSSPKTDTKNTTPETKTTPNTLSLPSKPAINAVPDFSNQNTQSSATLGVYKFTDSTISPELAIQYATSLGFTENPKVNTDPVFGQTLSWNTKTKYLIIRSGLRQVSYAEYPTTTKKSGFNSQILSSWSEKFLTNFNTYFGTSLKTTGVKYFNTTSDESKTPAQSTNSNLAEVDVTQTVEGKQIIGLSTITPLPQLRYNTAGELIYAELILPAQDIQKINDAAIISVDEIKANFSKATPLFTFHPTEQDPFSDPPVEKLTVENVVLSLYQDSVNKQLTPVFLISTSGRSAKGTRVNIDYVLNATKQP